MSKIVLVEKAGSFLRDEESIRGNTLRRKRRRGVDGCLFDE